MLMINQYTEKFVIGQIAWKESIMQSVASFNFWFQPVSKRWVDQPQDNTFPWPSLAPAVEYITPLEKLLLCAC